MSAPRSLALSLVLAAACTGTPTTALFALPGGAPGDDFYALPFPNDLLRRPDGTLDLSAFPTNSLIVDSYRAAAEHLDGFGLNQPIYARFDGPLAPESLPDPAESLGERAAVYLVDVDPESPARGERIPIAVRFRAEPTVTLGANHLSARPYPGFPLAEGTTYALVVTTRVTGSNGDAIEPAAAFRDVLGTGGDLATQAARETYAPLLAWLDEPGGDERADVASAAVFTTQHATSIAPALRRGVLAAPAPVATDVMPLVEMPDLKVFTGAYQAPNFQRGALPYRNAPDGAIEIGPDGAAVVQRTETMRFAVSIPQGPTPANGWPIALYQHGTSGDYVSFVDDGTASALAAEGIAVISTDQVLHGPRNPGGDPQIDFFNISNPFAMRDNALQGAADAWSQLRLVRQLAFADGARAIRFDARQVFFFGHSQGGATGPGFVAFEPTLSGAVLSGTCGLISLSLLYKTQPLDVPQLLQTFLRDDPVDEDNPSLALAQMWIERADGINYAPLMVRQPPTVDGAPLAPRNIYQTEGFTDTYTPNPAIEAFATAIGGDVVQLVDQREVPGLALRGRRVLAPPFSNNVGSVTAALAQFRQLAGSDGHFVVFDHVTARHQAARFLGTLARTGTATVVPPP